MLPLPEQPPVMKATHYGDGKNGYAWQNYRSDEYGVECKAVRAKGRAPWKETWTCDFMPNVECDSYEQLRKASLAVRPSECFAPKVLGVEGKSKGSMGRCWRCDGEWVWTVVVQTGWRDHQRNRIPTCGPCMVPTQQAPLEVIARRHKQVAEQQKTLDRIRNAADDKPEPDIPF